MQVARKEVNTPCNSSHEVIGNFPMLTIRHMIRCVWCICYNTMDIHAQWRRQPLHLFSLLTCPLTSNEHRHVLNWMCVALMADIMRCQILALAFSIKWDFFIPKASTTGGQIAKMERCNSKSGQQTLSDGQPDPCIVRDILMVHFGDVILWLLLITQYHTILQPSGNTAIKSIKQYIISPRWKLSFPVFRCTHPPSHPIHTLTYWLSIYSQLIQWR